MADFEKIIRNHVAADGNIPTTAINAIVTDIKQAVGNEYVEKERYKAKLTEIDALKEKAQNAEDSVTTAGKWKEKYDALELELKNYKAEVAKKETRSAKEAAYKEVLKDAGIPEKHYAKILKYSDVDGIDLDDKGKAKNAKELLASVKEEWSDHIETQGKQGASISNPPANNGGGTGKTKDEIMKIKDSAERQKAIAENHELFGF
jgi:hypothetical protein